MYLWLE